LCHCLICEEKSFGIAVNNLSYHINYRILKRPLTIMGFTCWNPKCGMYQVVIPISLCYHVDEIPDELLPEGWEFSKPTDKESYESDSGKPGT
jgi:hypothetical protein